MASRFLTIGALLAAVASAAPAPAGGDGCLPFCQSAFDACNAGATTIGNPNHPLCASWFSQCLGYNPFNGNYVAPTACADVSAAPPIPTSSGAPDACASACLAAYESCSGSPGECAYKVSACLGDSPFYNGLYVAPAACDSYKEKALASASASASASGAAVVTTVVTSYTTYCPGPTSIVHGNKTITVTGATTLTVTDCPCTITTNAQPVQPTNAPAPPAPQPTAASCLDQCNAAHVACQNAPGANMSLCAAQYASCLGYNPWGSGSYVTPTACAASGTAAPTAAPTTPVVVTAGAAGLAVPGALAALGALALL